MGAELGSLLFSSSIRFFQLAYLKKKKKVCLLFVLCISPCPLTLLSDAVDGQSSSTCKSEVCCIYKCTVIAACVLHGGSPWKREEKSRRGDAEKAATRLHARLLQEPERCRDSQRAPCPGVLGCWFLAGVYRGIDRLSGWIWLAFCPEPFLHPPQSIPPAGGDPRSISGCWGREAGRGCTWSAQPGQRLRAPCCGRNARQRKELRGRQKLPLLLV